MITPKLVSIRTKSGDDITPAEMMRDYLGLSQRQQIEAMAEKRQATLLSSPEWSALDPIQAARWLRDNT